MKTAHWTALAWFSALDIGLAAGVAYALKPPEPWVLFFAVLGVIWLLPMAIGVWGYAKYWLAYHAFNKRALVRNIKADFHRNEFPSSAAFIDPDDYLKSVMADEENSTLARSRAAFLLGEKAAARSIRPMTDGLAIDSAYTVAMEEYRP